VYAAISLQPFSNLKEEFMIRLVKGTGAFLVLLFWVTLTSQLFAQQRCGVERWSVKTGTDADVQNVGLSNPPQPATIAQLIALPPPNPIPKDNRVTPTETTVFVVNATLTDYKLEGGSKGDSDYHLVLQDDQGNTMVAEIPSPHCVDNSSPFAAKVANARAEFDSQLTAGPSFQTANIPVQVTGVGFFDFAHGQHGAAPNVIELHPVLDIIFNPQQQNNNGDFALSLPSSTVHIAQGGSSTIPVTTSTTGGNVPNIVLSTSGLPTGISGDFTPIGNGKSTLSLTAAGTAPTGTFPFTVTGTAGTKSHSQIVSLDVSGTTQPPTEEWEYQVISANSEQDVITQANKLGADDWEMVSAVKVSGTPAWRAFFKRTKRNF
jgi:hypothetical protein